MSVYASPYTVTDADLVLCLDAANQKSYPGSGTTWSDLSARRHSGTLTSGSTISNGAAIFDGINDHVSFANPGAITSSLTLNNVSMEVWFMQTTAASSQCIFFIGNPGASGFGFYMGPCASESNRLGLVHGGIICYRVSYLGIVANRWYHAVYVKGSSTDNYLYLNGSLVNTGTGDFTTPATSVFMGLSGTIEPFTGRIAIAKLYKKALSANEVLQNYNATKTRFGL